MAGFQERNDQGVRLGGEKAVEPDEFTPLGQIVHGKHTGVEVMVDEANDIVIVANGSGPTTGTWTIDSRGMTNVGTYTPGSNDFGVYTLFGNLCHCRFGIDGSISGLDLGEINLITLPFPAIQPWGNANDVPLTIGDSANANNNNFIRLEANLPTGWAILTPNIGDRDFGDYGHFWYFADISSLTT